MPTGGPATAATGAVGAVAAAAAKDGATVADGGGAAAGKGGRAIDCSRSASWRSASLQSIRPDVTAARPSAILRSSSCVRSARSASLAENWVMTAVNLSTMTWIRGRAMSRQANAEPTIGPTRPARSRTTSFLSPGAACAAPASNALNKRIVKRVVIANLREAKVILDRSAHIVASPKRRFYRRVTKVLESMLIFDAIA